MFVLADMRDTVTIKPWQFKQKRIDCISNILNSKLANKVVTGVGLCITLWDIQSVADAYIFPGDGSSHSVVYFRFVVFRPFIDEVLVGRIKSCSRAGVHVTLNFFDDIMIPADSLQNPSTFNEKEQLWTWQYDSHELFMDIGEEIRFRVKDECFIDTSPTGPEGSDPVESTEERKCPYSLIGSVSEPGLGLLSWWG